MPCIGLDDTNCCTFGATVALCLLRRAANLSLRDVASWCSILRSIGKCQAKKMPIFKNLLKPTKTRDQRLDYWNLLRPTQYGRPEEV